MPTKSSAFSQVSQSFAASTNYTGTPINLSAQNYAEAVISFTTGTTAPTAAAIASLMVSPDNANYYLAGSFASSVVASTPTSGVIEIPPGASWARVDVAGPGGSAITGMAQIEYGTD